MEEGEICDRDNTQHKVHEAAPGVSDSKTYIERTLKRKSELNITEKSAKIERRPKRSKDAAETSGQQRRCRVKMLMIGRPKPSDIPPSLPSLRVYKDYLCAEDAEDNTQTTRTFESSVPLEEQVVYDDIIETTEVVDLGVEMDIAVERSK